MKLISGIEIEGFRSIRSGGLPDICSFTALAGVNNSGKSNVLRALNAFFTGETNPGQSLDMDTDYCQRIKSKRKKLIKVTVHFELPERFSFHKYLEEAESLLGRSFSVTKEWAVRRPQPTYYLNGEGLDLQKRQRVEQFLQLINFRYIPNRVLPLAVIQQEHQGLRDV